MFECVFPKQKKLKKYKRPEEFNSAKYLLECESKIRKNLHCHRNAIYFDSFENYLDFTVSNRSELKKRINFALKNEKNNEDLILALMQIMVCIDEKKFFKYDSDHKIYDFVYKNKDLGDPMRYGSMYLARLYSPFVMYKAAYEKIYDRVFEVAETREKVKELRAFEKKINE